MVHVRISAVIVVAASVVVSGCSGQFKAGKGASVPGDASALYQRGDYAGAFEAASTRARSATGRERERLALIAGLSAQARDRNSEAAYWLNPLTRSDDRDISGRASAAMGLIEQEQGRHHSAIAHLKSASDKLAGDEAAKARFYLGESQASAGLPADAARSYRTALDSATDARLRRIINERLTLDAYTIQLGAFRDPRAAQQAAATAAPRARSLGLPAPKVTARTLPTGKSVNVVHLGVYRTMSQAQADRARFGGNTVVARAAGG